jgi:hypothetical protein
MASVRASAVVTVETPAERSGNGVHAMLFPWHITRAGTATIASTSSATCIVVVAAILVDTEVLDTEMHF